MKVVAPTQTKVVNKVVNNIDDGQPWGVAKQIDDVTWQMKVGQDAQMGTPS